MKKIATSLCAIFLLFALSGCVQEQLPQQETEAPSQTASIPAPESVEEDEPMQISVRADGGIVVFELNDSRAAQMLYEQLPLTIEVENYSTNEKIFYPPQELDTGDAPQADGGAGTLAYYAPWGDVVMFYGDFNPSGGLYELGNAVSGDAQISQLSGTVQIERAEN